MTWVEKHARSLEISGGLRCTEISDWRGGSDEFLRDFTKSYGRERDMGGGESRGTRPLSHPKGQMI